MDTQEDDDDDSNYETGFHSDSYDIIVHEIIVKADFDFKSPNSVAVYKYFIQYLNSKIIIHSNHR